MGAPSKTCKWRASLAVRIAKQWGVSEGSAVEMVSRGNEVLPRKKTDNLADMLATVTDENLHPEVYSGPAQGDEAW